MKEKQLIFIVSQPRAGSTLLQNLLSNNDFVNTTSEHWMLLNFANQLKPQLIAGEFDNDSSKDAFNTYIEKVGRNFYSEKLKSFLLSLYEPLLGEHNYVLDKTPRYWEILEEIKTIFPQSKIIILKRNPVSVLKSIINTWNKTTVKSLENIKRDFVLAPAALHTFSVKYKNDINVRTIRYEDLILNLESSVKDIYEWLEIDFDQDSLNTERNIKIKGKYGDPYQNSDKDYKSTKSQVVNLVDDNPQLKSFINEYEYFLGPTFLKEYGEYEISSKEPIKSKFKDFFIISTLKEYQKLKKEINLIKSSESFKLGKLLSWPIRFYKKLRK